MHQVAKIAILLSAATPAAALAAPVRPAPLPVVVAAGAPLPAGVKVAKHSTNFLPIAGGAAVVAGGVAVAASGGSSSPN